MVKSAKNSRVLEYAIHIIGWGIVFLLPLFFFSMSENTDFDIMKYLKGSVMPSLLCMLFYLNYFCLVPHYMFKGNSLAFIGINAVVILMFCFLAQYASMKIGFFPADLGGPGGPGGPEAQMMHEGMPREMRPEPRMGGPRPRLHLIAFFRDFVSMALICALAAAIRMGRRIAQAEQTRKEAEMQNLKSQINPHFLLNTLNNIYALISFDSAKAQDAVQELSRLLRYALYDVRQDFVPLHKEVDFIRNYISLMEIRLPGNVDVQTRIDVPEDSRTPVAPLLFISLIENAFKHGISTADKNYIRIWLRETDKEIECRIENSSHPKKENDKSGSGIGLEQVQKRLELMYKGAYSWDKGEDPSKQEYHSYLTLKKKKMEAAALESR